MDGDISFIYKNSIDSLRVAADFLIKEERDKAASILLSMKDSIDILEKKVDESFFIYKQSLEELSIEAMQLHQTRTIKNNAINSLQEEISFTKDKQLSLEIELEAAKEPNFLGINTERLHEVKRRLSQDIANLKKMTSSLNNNLMILLDEKKWLELEVSNVDIVLKENNHQFRLASNGQLFFGRTAQLLNDIDNRLDDLKDLIDLLDKPLTIADRFGVDEVIPLHIALEQLMEYIGKQDAIV